MCSLQINITVNFYSDYYTKPQEYSIKFGQEHSLSIKSPWCKKSALWIKKKNKAYLQSSKTSSSYGGVPKNFKIW